MPETHTSSRESRAGARGGHEGSVAWAAMRITSALLSCLFCVLRFIDKQIKAEWAAPTYPTKTCTSGGGAKFYDGEPDGKPDVSEAGVLPHHPRGVTAVLRAECFGC